MYVQGHMVTTDGKDVIRNTSVRIEEVRSINIAMCQYNLKPDEAQKHHA